MPRRAKDVRQLIHTMVRQLEGVARVTEWLLLPGRDGTPHEVGIAIEATAGERPVRIAVEYHADPRAAGVTWVDELRAKYRNLAVDQVVAVAKERFKPAARTHAAAHNIRALSLAAACSEDWVRLVDLVANGVRLGGAD